MKVHSELNQTSTMKFFAKVVNCWKPLTIFVKSSTLDVWLGSEYFSSVGQIDHKGRVTKKC